MITLSSQLFQAKQQLGQAARQNVEHLACALQHLVMNAFLSNLAILQTVPCRVESTHPA
jgi:hypothetical protein